MFKKSVLKHLESHSTRPSKKYLTYKNPNLIMWLWGTHPCWSPQREMIISGMFEVTLKWLKSPLSCSKSLQNISLIIQSQFDDMKILFRSIKSNIKLILILIFFNILEGPS